MLFGAFDTISMWSSLLGVFLEAFLWSLTPFKSLTTLARSSDHLLYFFNTILLQHCRTKFPILSLCICSFKLVFVGRQFQRDFYEGVLKDIVVLNSCFFRKLQRGSSKGVYEAPMLKMDSLIRTLQLIMIEMFVGHHFVDLSINEDIHLDYRCTKHQIPNIFPNL